MSIIPGKLHTLAPKTMVSNHELKLHIQHPVEEWEYIKTLSREDCIKLEHKQKDREITLQNNSKLELVIYEVVLIGSETFYCIRLYKEKKKGYFRCPVPLTEDWFTPHPDAKIISLSDYKKSLLIDIIED